MVREVEVRGRQVSITEGPNPEDARLVIDGTNIPLVYHDGFKGWGVEHTLFGFFSDLKTLAEQMITSNPDLVIGHGRGYGDHGGGGHHDH